MGNHTAVFTRKLKEYESLIRYASRRYQIRGVLDPDDLYQEGLLILDKMLRPGVHDYEHEFDPDSVDFRKMFKTELWHGLWKVLQKCKAQKRDWKKIVHKDYSQLEKNASRSGRCGAPTDDQVGLDLVGSLSDASYVGGSSDRSLSDKLAGDVFSHGLNPEQQLEAREYIEDLDEFIDTLICRLDDEARVVLSELLYPRDWDEIPDDCKTNGYEDEYWRVPKRVPQHVLARMLDWPLIRVRRSISRIRKHAAAIGEELNMPRVAAGFKKRKRRKNVASA